jgi:cobyrinic acid a,c-diamide synthase
LTPPVERDDPGGVLESLASQLEEHGDADAILELAFAAPPLPDPPAEDGECDETGPAEGEGTKPGTKQPVVGYLSDSAFSFYYSENLEALEAAGARLCRISSIGDAELPSELDALYAGGGFPEVHAEALSANSGFLRSLATRASGGMPVFAECGGLMLLARSLTSHGRRWCMAGVLPCDIEVHERPAGHGYTRLTVDRPNPYFPVGARLKGHEFHYSTIVAGEGPGLLQTDELTVCSVDRGVGCGRGRDAIAWRNVWGSYTHFHADAVASWAPAFVSAARDYRKRNR